MRRLRKHPRINLRFKDHQTMDEFELAALKQGLSLSAWIKMLMVNELNKSNGSDKLNETAVESILITRKHMENRVPDDQVEGVRLHVKSYMNQVKARESPRD